MFGAMFEEILNHLHDARGESAERSRIIALLQKGQLEIMAKFDKLNSDLDALEAAVATLATSAPAEDDSADVAALEARVEKATSDVQAKVTPAPTPAPVNADTTVSA